MSSKKDDQASLINRRALLGCAAWAGAGLLWSIKGGVPRSIDLLGTANAAEVNSKDFMFAQISDSHIGFNKPANPDPVATLNLAIDQVKALSRSPAFILHTGDVSHLSKPDEFDTASSLLQRLGGDVHYVPGEHDVIGDNGASFFERFNGNAQRRWYSFDQGGVHFVALVNVLDLQAGGFGRLGAEQLEWLEKDLKGKSASTPIVIFTHMPLWTVYADWGWGTDDSAQALAYAKRFGSVTVLNGHIHQVLQKVEGHVHFHSARSTAFPQPAPGAAPSPGPMVVEAAKLKSVLGIATLTQRHGNHDLTITDSTLGA